MSSIFKSKRINSDPKSSASSKSSGKDPDGAKSQRNSGSTSNSKSGTGGAAAATATHSKTPNHSKAGGKGGTERSRSVDVPVWADEDCPAAVDSRFAGSTVTDKTLSISRSGRYKAKGKIRASLFSDESIDGTDFFQDGDKRGTTTRALSSSSSTSYEDRTTVLHASGSRVKSSEVAASNWSATPNSVNL